MNFQLDLLPASSRIKRGLWNFVVHDLLHTFVLLSAPSTSYRMTEYGWTSRDE